jgi:hypothetical protein
VHLSLPEVCDPERVTEIFKKESSSKDGLPETRRRKLLVSKIVDIKNKKPSSGGGDLNLKTVD